MSNNAGDPWEWENRGRYVSRQYYPPLRPSPKNDPLNYSQWIRLADHGVVEAGEVLWRSIARDIEQGENIPGPLRMWMSARLQEAVDRPSDCGQALRLQRGRGQRTANVSLDDATLRDDLRWAAAWLVLNALEVGVASTINSARSHEQSAAEFVASNLMAYDNLGDITASMVEKWFYERRKADPEFDTKCARVVSTLDSTTS